MNNTKLSPTLPKLGTSPTLEKGKEKKNEGSLVSSSGKERHVKTEEFLKTDQTANRLKARFDTMNMEAKELKVQKQQQTAAFLDKTISEFEDQEKAIQFAVSDLLNQIDAEAKKYLSYIVGAPEIEGLDPRKLGKFKFSQRMDDAFKLLANPLNKHHGEEAVEGFQTAVLSKLDEMKFEEGSSKEKIYDFFYGTIENAEPGPIPYQIDPSAKKLDSGKIEKIKAASKEELDQAKKDRKAVEDALVEKLISEAHDEEKTQNNDGSKWDKAINVLYELTTGRKYSQYVDVLKTYAETFEVDQEKYLNKLEGYLKLNSQKGLDKVFERIKPKLIDTLGEETVKGIKQKLDKELKDRLNPVTESARTYLIASIAEFGGAVLGKFDSPGSALNEKPKTVYELLVQSVVAGVVLGGLIRVFITEELIPSILDNVIDTLNSYTKNNGLTAAIFVIVSALWFGIRYAFFMGSDSGQAKPSLITTK